MTGYLYDVFLSYRRTGNVEDWVQTHLSKLLKNCLADELDAEPRIFLDVQMETGVCWPAELERGLRHSRLMVAVLSPPYFTSTWCMAEWNTMTQREAAVSLTGLIYPLVFSDGERFPNHAKERQCRPMKNWAYPYEQFADSQAFLAFHDEVRKIAADLATRFESVPAWDANWPVGRPAAVPPLVPAELPEL